MLAVQLVPMIMFLQQTIHPKGLAELLEQVEQDYEDYVLPNHPNPEEARELLAWLADFRSVL